MKTVEVEKDVGAGMELAPYVAVVIEQLKRERKFPAAHGYLCALHSFQRFAGGGDVPLPMDEVFTRERLKAYEEWLLVRQKRELNTVSDYMRTLRAVYNRLMPPGTAGHDPKMFGDVYTKVVSKTKRALNKRQIEHLLAVDASFLTKEQQAVLAYFLLMFMLRGMPFIDLAHLRKSNIRNGYLMYHRHKTKKPLSMEVPPHALRLIEQYSDTGSDVDYLFPILQKDLHSGWEEYQCYQSALRRFNRILKEIIFRLLPDVQISSYTARHTWATLAYHMGVPVGRISQSLGHSSIRVTEVYLKPFDNKQLDETNRQVLASVKKSKWKDKAVFNTL